MIFGLFGRKQLPLIRDEDIRPVDQPISTKDAKRLFREVLTQLSGRLKLDRQDVSLYAEGFADDMRAHGEDLADEIKDETKGITALEQELNSKRKNLENASGSDERDQLLEEISDLEDDLKGQQEYLDEITADLNKFKKDKRHFLREQLNELIQQHNERGL